MACWKRDWRSSIHLFRLPIRGKKQARLGRPERACEFGVLKPRSRGKPTQGTGCEMGSVGGSANETVLIAGAGMVGLGAGLALANGKRQITLIERDPPPPALAPHDLFQEWERRGVAQLRHSHIFLGRLMVLFRDHFPFLMEELLAAGGRLFSFEDALGPDLKAGYRPSPGDEDLALLYCRRTTLEFVLRRHVERLPGVSVMPATQVR